MILFQPRPTEYAAGLEYAKSEGFAFELTDFMFAPVLDDLQICFSLLKKFDGAPVRALHGPFADLNFSGGDPEIMAVTKQRIVRCCQCAKELDVHKMVLHSCYFPLMPPDSPLYPLWSENTGELLSELAAKFEMTFCLENLLDITPDILVGMLKAAKGNPRIRATLDAGHANLSKTRQEDWNRALAPWLIHFHFSDNHGMYDDHIALGEGNVDWDGFFATLPPATPETDYTLEVNGLDAVMRSAEYLKKRGFIR